MDFLKPCDAATTNRSSTFLRLDGVRTTLRRDVELDFSKVEGVCTTLRRDVKRTLECSKPDGVRTTLRCDVERTLDFSKLDNVRTPTEVSHLNVVVGLCSDDPKDFYNLEDRSAL